MSLLFNMLSRLVITFLPRSKHLLISWLQSPSAVILEPPKIKSVTVSIVSIYLPWSDGTWLWVKSGSWWWTGRPGMLQFMGSQRVRHYWVTELNWTELMGADAMISVFWMLSFKPTYSLSSFTFIKRLFSSSSLSAIRVVSSTYMRLLIFLLAILIPACDSSSPAFLMM